MRIGVDFDNTIACYDGVFHAAAREQGLIPTDLPQGKNAVRDHLNGSGRKDAFTALQGYVYGSRMDLASPYPGVLDFVAAARAAGHELVIVSHKTRTPILGPAFDMHAAARGFLEAHGLVGEGAVQTVHFELTKDEKIARIAALDVDLFIDDLPDILAHPGFPPRTRAILFDPDRRFATETLPWPRHETWPALTAAVLGG